MLGVEYINSRKKLAMPPQVEGWALPIKQILRICLLPVLTPPRAGEQGSTSNPQRGREKSMSGLSRGLSLLLCLIIFSALPILAQIQHGVPWRDAGAPSGSAPAGAHLSYFGGPVVSDAHVVQVLYGTGSYNPQVAGASSPTMGNFFGDLLGTNSGYINLLTQYSTSFSGGTNQTIGNGIFGGIFQITPSAANNGPTIDDSNIQAELLAQINAGHLPVPVLDAAGNVNTIYMIYFPPGKIITEHGSTSCVAGGFCAYHGTTSSTLNSKHLLYGVMPDMQAGSGCSTGCGTSSVFGNYTSVTSHELSEAITDADVGLATSIAAPLAWYDPNNGEIGDICNGQQGSYTANGTIYTIQLEFSNAANNCVLPPTASPGTRHVFYLDSAGHVHQLYSTARSWSDVDLTALTGAPSAQPGSGLTSILDSATNSVHVYFANGGIHELYGTGTTWFSDNPTALAGTGAMPGPGDGPTSIIGTGSIIHVFYMQNVQNLIELYWLGGTNWHADSPSSLAGESAPCNNEPSALTSLMDRSNGNNIMHVYCLGTFQDVYEFYWTGGSAWHTAVPTSLAKGPGASVNSNITSFIDNSGGTASIIHVYYLGTNLNVYELYYTGSWHSDDPTSLAGAPAAGVVSGQLSPLTSFINTSGTGDTGIHVMYLGTNDHLYALHWPSGTSWSYFDATASAGAPAAAPDSALASFQDLAGGVRVYYLGANSHVYELYWQSEGHASETDLTVTSGGSIAASGSPLSGVIGP